VLGLKIAKNLGWYRIIISIFLHRSKGL